MHSVVFVKSLIVWHGLLHDIKHSIDDIDQAEVTGWHGHVKFIDGSDRDIFLHAIFESLAKNNRAPCRSAVSHAAG